MARKKATVQSVSLDSILSNVSAPSTTEIAETAEAGVAANTIEPPPVVSVKGKREKKTTKHKVVAVVTPDGIQGSFQSDVRRPLIVSLPIHSNDVSFENQPFIYNPNVPEDYDAYNANVTDPFAEESTYEKAPDNEGVQKTEISTKAEASGCSSTLVQPVSVAPAPVSVAASVVRKEYGPTTLLVQFSSTKQSKELPADSSLSCFWCCESFSGRPCVIPMRIVESVWNVYGNFCLPQCAMAYLLSEILDTHTRWERIALLNRLYGGQCNGRIYPAPSRESLQRFGGPICVDEFRNMCESQRIRVDVHMPPIVSILSSMDTKPIDFYETPLRNTFASPYAMQVQRATDEPQGLKLRRTKPLKDKESTLDACLNIKMH
jgi:hypothetical protein